MLIFLHTDKKNFSQHTDDEKWVEFEIFGFSNGVLGRSCMFVALTNNSDFYVAIQDAGINRLVKHVMRKRPSLFNYGTSLVASNPHLLCQNVDVAPEVLHAGNPLVTVLPPLPIIGTSSALNYCVQLTKGELDFHPENVFTLPSELNPPLGKQRLGRSFSSLRRLRLPSGNRSSNSRQITRKSQCLNVSQDSWKRHICF